MVASVAESGCSLTHAVLFDLFLAYRCLDLLSDIPIPCRASDCAAAKHAYLGLGIWVYVRPQLNLEIGAVVVIPAEQAAGAPWSYPCSTQSIGSYL